MRMIVFDEYGTKLTVMRENHVITGELIIMGDAGEMELSLVSPDEPHCAVSFYLSAEQRRDLIEELKEEP